ncbi:hypothetical protein KJ969_03875 [Patescibacteria group bacterium]|nr:hypothetical protein [Patescibacteria group bacterium]MBU1921757.1 hypothetical protein [Patescibacteria group bacterium]
MEDYSKVREFLRPKLEPDRVPAALIQAECDEIVITVVTSKCAPDRPFATRVKIMDKNETLNGVLLMGADHKFSDFPADYPCLRFDPPHFDEFWPDRPEDDLDQY